MPAEQQNEQSPGAAPIESVLRATATVATDGFSIAALVLGILGISVLGLILGLIGMRRTKDGRVGGRGLAVAGVVLSILWLLGGSLLAALLVYGARTGTRNTDSR